jgi:alpha-L-fucosidase
VKGVRLDSPDHAAADRQAIRVPRPEEFQPWESCMTINDTWAYRGKDRNFKSADALIRALVKIVSRGGNFLLDVGPQPDGAIQPEFVERLEAVGRWVHRNAAAIYGSTYGPVQGEAAYRTTANGASVYVFAMDEGAREIRVKGLRKAVKSVTALGAGTPVPFTAMADGARIRIAKELWAEGVPVLKVE